MPNTSKSRSKTHSSSPSAPSHSRSISHALQNVRRLPRKASRLVCIVDPSDRGRQDSVKQDGGVGPGHGVEEEEAEAESVGLVRCSESRLGSGSENGSASSGGYSASVSSQISDSSSSISSPPRPPARPIWTPGPILSPDELAHALARYSRTSSPNTVNPNPDSDARDLPRHIKEERTLENLIAAAAADDPIPRPLSPPPDHFRRRNPGSPYTSPVHSPPASPRHHPCARVRVHSQTHVRGPGMGRESECEGEGRDGHAKTRGQTQAQEQGARPIRLHDLLSSESLVAPPLKLYNSADDSSSDSDSILALTLDLDRNLRVSGPPPRPAPRLRRTERGSIFSQPRPRSRPRSRARETPTRSSVSGNERDTHALRRVLSR